MNFRVPTRWYNIPACWNLQTACPSNTSQVLFYLYCLIHRPFFFKMIYLLFILLFKRLKACLFCFSTVSLAWTRGKLCSGAQLKAGLGTPETLRTGALLPLRRRSEKMKKQTLTTPRMITPEISALVTVFIWNPGDFRWAEIAQEERRHRICVSLSHVPPVCFKLLVAHPAESCSSVFHLQ